MNMWVENNTKIFKLSYREHYRTNNTIYIRQFDRSLIIVVIIEICS